jgi:hypothetical protein
MLSTFTTSDGTLIIRTQDIRRIEDAPEETTLAYWEEGHMVYRPIQGTARENLDRLKQEELDEIAAATARQLALQAQQQRVQNGLPQVPLLRGKPGRG